jgi:hypothetical protein
MHSIVTWVEFVERGGVGDENWRESVKNLLKIRWIAAFVVALIVAVPCIAQAGTITYSTSASQATEWSGVLLSLPKFDPINGILTSVDLELKPSVDSDLSAANISTLFPPPGPSNGTASTITDFTISLPFSVTSGTTTVNSLALNVQANATFSNLPADSTLHPLGHASSFPQNDFYVPTQLAYFNGPGTFSLSANTTTLTSCTYSGGFTGAQPSSAPVAGLTAIVIYNFTPVPEPSTVALLSTGVVGLLGWALRRRMS